MLRIVRVGRYSIDKSLPTWPVLLVSIIVVFDGTAAIGLLVIPVLFTLLLLLCCTIFVWFVGFYGTTALQQLLALRALLTAASNSYGSAISAPACVHPPTRGLV